MTIQYYVRVQPGAKQNLIEGIIDYDGHKTLKIRLQSPPVDGKANAHLVKFLSKQLNVPANRITIKTGHTSRMKLLTFDIEPAIFQAFLKSIDLFA